jgi:hypothetical protein
MCAMLAALLVLPGLVRAAVPGGVNATLGNGVYNSSKTPATLAWNTYNYCNAPHVNAPHYTAPAEAHAAGAALEHLTVVMRHHKARLFDSQNERSTDGACSARRTTCTQTRTR